MRSRRAKGETGIVPMLAAANIEQTLRPSKLKCRTDCPAENIGRQPLEYPIMAKAKKHLGSADDIEAAFYDAISRADLDAMMALWADDEEIVCIHPGGMRLIGHAPIRSAWEAIFKNGGVPIHPVQLHVTHNLMTAVHSVAEEIHLPQGEQSDFHVVATNVYLKTPAGWRIVAHHASLAPGKLVVRPATSATLH